jgi:hypothetical protein
MPVSQLSKDTIVEGYQILKEISNKVNNGGPGPLVRKIVDKPNMNVDETSMNVDKPNMNVDETSMNVDKISINVDKENRKYYYDDESDKVALLHKKYYTKIPHTHAPDKSVSVLDRLQTIRQEIPLLETLADIQLSKNIMSAAQADKDKSKDQVALVDAQYARLNMKEMTPLDHGSDEFKELENYLMRSKDENIFYNVLDIFRIERAGEEERFKNSKYYGLVEEKSDRRLLWHGTRTASFGAILSQGLRIAPFEADDGLQGLSGDLAQGLRIGGSSSEMREAPQDSSRRFGKGIYLASQSSK